VLFDLGALDGVSSLLLHDDNDHPDHDEQDHPKES
jgi:hypothetical protein